MIDRRPLYAIEKLKKKEDTVRWEWLLYRPFPPFNVSIKFVSQGEGCIRMYACDRHFGVAVLIVQP